MPSRDSSCSGRSRSSDPLWSSARAATKSCWKPFPNWFGTCTEIEDQKRAGRAVLQKQKIEGIGRLAGGVAHDFNNLLTGIILGANCAMESLPGTHPAQEMLQVVVQASERAAELTRRM